MKRLGIVVPYRDWMDHLQQLVPALATYFTRDKLDKDIPVSLVVVEQQPGLPFNRGLIKNISFKLLCENVDYVCFHDVDLLPLWADYRYPQWPTMIVWYGVESRPFNPANPDRRLWYQLELCLGGYWGWGMEDIDLKNRLEQAGFKTEHRKGTFQPLLHVHDGFVLEGTPTALHLRNEALFKSRWQQPKGDWRDAGLNTTAYRVLEKRKLAVPQRTRSDIAMEHILIAFDNTPPANHG